jgi:protein strawberry notch
MARETATSDEFARSHWRVAPEAEFAPLWEAECARVPEFSESAFHIITGLLLPIWDRLPAENMRVCRFETDDGERVIGRLVTPEALDRLYQGLGATDAPALSPEDFWTAVEIGSPRYQAERKKGCRGSYEVRSSGLPSRPGA